MKPPSAWQRGLQFFGGHLFVPDGLTAGGNGLGAAWTTDTAAKGTTLSHATPGTAFDTQMKRTVYTQSAPGGAANNDQELGPRQSLASEYAYWAGNARYCGGFYMSTVFRIENWDDDTGRLFVGMSASANSVAAGGDTPPNNTVGLWHSGAMAQDELWLIIKNNAGSTANNQLTQHVGAGASGVEVNGILATGVTLVWEMWCYPNMNSNPGFNCQLSFFDVSTDSEALAYNRVKRIKWLEQGGTWTTNKMLAPQVQMSNGATDVTAGHFSIGVANIYCAPWSGEMD